jgi:drug/metabolite transporter (DMT)-like permease
LLRTQHLVGHFIRSILMFGAYTCFYLALSALPLSEAISLFFSAPIFITILSFLFMGEKVEVGDWLAVIVGFLGVAIMLKPGANLIDPASILGVLTALLYATASITTRKLGKTESGVSMAFYLVVMHAVFSAIAAIILHNVVIADNHHPSAAFLFRAWQVPAQNDILFFIGIGLIAAFGYYFLSQAYRLASPSMIAPFEYFAVPLSVLWGYFVWRDVLEIQAIIGTISIVGSGLYMFCKKGELSDIHVCIFKTKFRK